MNATLLQSTTFTVNNLHFFREITCHAKLSWMMVLKNFRQIKFWISKLHFSVHLIFWCLLIKLNANCRNIKINTVLWVIVILLEFLRELENHERIFSIHLYNARFSSSFFHKSLWRCICSFFKRYQGHSTKIGLEYKLTKKCSLCKKASKCYLIETKILNWLKD